MLLCKLALLAVPSLPAAIAAYYWFKSSKVQIDFGYRQPGDPPEKTYRMSGIVLPRMPESGDPAIQRMHEQAATWSAIEEASKLNSTAATWTFVSIVATVACAWIGQFIA